MSSNQKCQQFTPKDQVDEMLDLIGYKNNIFGKKFLENSCGTGNILCIAIQRYIDDARRLGISDKEIVEGLERDICGVEIDIETRNKCVDNLNEIIHAYNLGDIKWNIICKDVLKLKFDQPFDYIVGNPPYISYRDLSDDDRKYIKKNYITCKKGKPDYCYAFIENAINNLAECGYLAYLVPNSIYKNEYAKELRDLLLDYVIEIRDYSQINLFDKIQTSSSILSLQKQKTEQPIKYYKTKDQIPLFIERASLKEEKWVFGYNMIEKKIESAKRFGDYYKASMAIATQRNNIFVLDEETIQQNNIEEGILRHAASPKNLSKKDNKKNEYIIFPYSIQGEEVSRYQSIELKNDFPNAYLYLKENEEELLKRDKDKNAEWFEYGRSQALQHINKNKLLVSTVVTTRINVYELDEETIPYAGIFITALGDNDLNDAKKILESEDFLEYAKGNGTPASGKSVRITVNVINNYIIPDVLS